MAETAVDRTGIDVAIARQAGRKIHNCVYRKPTLFGLFRALDNYYNSEAPRIDKIDVVGGSMRFDLIAGMPKAQGVDPLNADYNLRRLDLVKRTVLKSGSLLPSAFQIGEPIDKYEYNRIKTQDLLDKWVQKVGNLCAEAVNTLGDDWLFPTDGTQAVGGAGYGTGNKARFAQFSYPLQNGYANNDTGAAANAFSYLELNMHDFPEAKAINVGKIGTTWVLSEQALYEDLIMALRDRGANIDIILAPKKAYSYLRQTLQKRITNMAPDRTMKFGGPFFMIDEGIFVVYESGLDRATYPELLVGDSSTIRFGLDPEGVSGTDVIESWPEMPSAMLLQGYGEMTWVNECPRWWGRAFNVEVQ